MTVEPDLPLEPISLRVWGFGDDEPPPPEVRKYANDANPPPGPRNLRLKSQSLCPTPTQRLVASGGGAAHENLASISGF